MRFLPNVLLQMLDQIPEGHDLESVLDYWVSKLRYTAPEAMPWESIAHALKHHLEPLLHQQPDLAWPSKVLAIWTNQPIE